MIAKEVLSQVRRIEIRTNRLVNETFGGQYLSVFKGRGVEFLQVREYVPGDDTRSIDRNVTARTGRLHVREYQDERELTVILACDLSGSQFFGTGQKLKQEVAAEIAALLAFSALRNNDKVGLLLFTEGAERYWPPKKGRTHILTLIRDLLAFKPKKRGTRLAESLGTLNRLLKRRSIVFLISDFQDHGYEKALRQTALKHDTIGLVIEDPRESELPALPAWIAMEDPETGERALIPAGSSAVRRKLKDVHRSRKEDLERLFRSAGMDFVRIQTDRPYADPLVQFFRRRAKRFR
jgi:uncharacterized protein (DUF58 family)